MDVAKEFYPMPMLPRSYRDWTDSKWQASLTCKYMFRFSLIPRPDPPEKELSGIHCLHML